MQVILLEKIRKLGNVGEKVEVKAGFGRNYLIPQNKAQYATAENIKLFEAKRAEFENKAQQALELAEQRASKLGLVTIEIAAMASDEGKLYGSIGANEIKEALKAQSFEVTKREIVMVEGPIHSVGEYKIEIHLHSDVIVSLPVHVVAK